MNNTICIIGKLKKLENVYFLCWEEEKRWKELISRKKSIEKKNTASEKEWQLLTEEKFWLEDAQKAENTWPTNLFLIRPRFLNVVWTLFFSFITTYTATFRETGQAGLFVVVNFYVTENHYTWKI